jgi:hypothetical protein
MYREMLSLNKLDEEQEDGIWRVGTRPRGHAKIFSLIVAHFRS